MPGLGREDEVGEDVGEEVGESRIEIRQAPPPLILANNYKGAKVLYYSNRKGQSESEREREGRERASRLGRP